MAKRGLGTGLDTLIPNKPHVDGKEQAVIKVKEVETVDIHQIEPNSAQPRKNFDEDTLQELAESIKQHGLIEPLVVQKEENGFYQIIAGERRWRAAKIAGLKRLPVVVKDYSARERTEVALIENLQREDLNPIEEAEAYRSLIKEYNMTQDEVAECVSKSRAAVTNTLRLLKLDERVREMLTDDKIKMGHARALLAIEDKNQQFETAMQVFDGKLSVRETENLVKRVLAGKAAKEEEVVTPEQEQQDLVYASYEEKLKDIMGTKVNIRRAKTGGSGKIEIAYYSQEEFERLMEMMSQIG